MKVKTFGALFEEAEKHTDYAVAGLVHDFTEGLAWRMDEQGISRAELARRLGTSPAYITKILRGNINFTLETLVRLAVAVGAEVRISMRAAKSSSARRPSERRTAHRWVPKAARVVVAPD